MPVVLPGVSTIRASVEENTTTAVSVNNQYTDTLGNLQIHKHFEGDDVIVPADLTFTVTGPAGFGTVTVPYSDFEETFHGAAYTFTNITIGEYTVTESSASVPGYTLTTTYTYNDAAVTGGAAFTVGPNDDHYIITNTYTVDKIDIPVEKVWADDDDRDSLRPDAVTVKLLADDVDTGLTLELNSSNGWTGTFEDVPQYDTGALIDYSIEELTVSGYTVSITENTDSNFTVTNTHIPSTVDIPVEKIWNDDHDRDGLRPDAVTVNLLANGTVIDSVELSEVNAWKHTFTGLPKYDNGTEIVYTVTEDEVSGYTSSITDAEGCWIIENSHERITTSIDVTKEWIDKRDAEGNRPYYITVELYANGEPTGITARITSKNDWSYTFEDLIAYENGEPIFYSVIEYSVSNYLTRYSEVTGNATDGYEVTITNTHKDIPQTGDHSDILYWTLGFLGCIGLGGTLMIRRKKES